MFVNYCVISKEYSESFEIQDVCVGDGGDCGIDGIAIIVNGRMVDSEDEVEDLIKLNGFLDVYFLMIQTKSSKEFDSGEIGTFGRGVVDFFSETPRLVRNGFIKKKAKITE